MVDTAGAGPAARRVPAAVDLYRIGELHFVRDGHHRVSVALALHLHTIEGYVTEVTTRLDATGIRHRGDLVTQYQRRLFPDPVPLFEPEVASIRVTRPRACTELSEAAEAWGSGSSSRRLGT